jgi:hypothetical protein
MGLFRQIPDSLKIVGHSGLPDIPLLPDIPNGHNTIQVLGGSSMGHLMFKINLTAFVDPSSGCVDLVRTF